MESEARGWTLETSFSKWPRWLILSEAKERLVALGTDVKGKGFLELSSRTGWLHLPRAGLRAWCWGSKYNDPLPDGSAVPRVGVAPSPRRRPSCKEPSRACKDIAVFLFFPLDQSEKIHGPRSAPFGGEDGQNAGTRPGSKFP